ncbi:MAG: 16S rRNA (cytosine(1402)-N(4))-methyltransferase RsmH [Prolixibacteraceae bacterium]|nr:16S rRNA (cytosine(1402)-N(4))-methyltransferase RsmH [Prolixibacteraceae bacterium]
MNEAYHIPVLPDESIRGLNLHPEADVVDATFGGGTHSQLILRHLGEGRLFAFDQDEDAAGNALEDNRLFFIRHNFRYVRNFLKFYGVTRVDSIFADLGVSSHDFDVPGRGFSFRFDSPLDMRMNQNAKTDAAAVINNYSADNLKFVFKIYGEIKNTNKLVSEIVKYRSEQPVRTTNQLKTIAAACAPRALENKYLAQVFQALRIEVNDEMEALKEFLKASASLLKSEGRLVIISYHSLEDRLCKNFMRAGNFEGIIKKDFFGNPETPFRLINRKVITPDAEELKNNNRARSARLRIAEKI